ncbi:putative haloacid dehalogenase-like hydrolase domain-containing protein 3-like [Capsicum annuum]|uniref:Phosphatidate cytidylyltransferase, mitochondrial n=1 Tax=Capsicum annuum TaxID=4072 RepID=A0A2G2Z3M7_CAPAN|nr:putative haloacid dehalogenase-like hydrolase domain-containing protein 3-like [Capsicum annuum]KAF3650456.1 putative haloacid dehalogenase-like hydrolase domain-containing protein 3-like [Capsicum annuum]PHT76554.1 hypothetical protein T459_20076 [Capsicum annuum]
MARSPWWSKDNYIADDIGVGVHFNPFVSCNNKMVKYGVVQMHDLIQDILGWERSQMAMKLGDERILDDTGRVTQQVMIGSKEQAAECMKRIVRRKVMFSSTRQAVAGLLIAGAVHGVRYVANKMH